RAAIVRRQRTPSATTSGPMPSPPRTAMRAFMGVTSAGCAAAFERVDRGSLLHQETELVHAIHEAIARKRLEREGHARAVRQCERGAFEIDRDFSTGMREQPRARRLVHQHWHETVLQRVAAEDIGELGAHDGAKAVVRQRPRSMLARGSASEVTPGCEDRAAPRGWLVEYEIRARRAAR